MSKTFNIPKISVLEAWKRVKTKGGGAGIDGATIVDFEKNLKDNLYRIWNRMCSGSYFPPLVRAVDIPKKNGGTRRLGVRTVADWVAQGVAPQGFLKMCLIQFSIPIPMGTERTSQHMMQLLSRGSDAGNTIGFWNLIFEAYSTIFHMNFLPVLYGVT